MNTKIFLIIVLLLVGIIVPKENGTWGPEKDWKQVRQEQLKKDKEATNGQQGAQDKRMDTAYPPFRY